MTRPVQRFTPEYLQHCANMTAGQRVRFLDDFRKVALASKSGVPGGTRKLISLRVPEATLAAFKAKADANGLQYQRKIQELMADWVRS